MINADMSFRHPDDGSDGKQPGRSTVADGLTPDEWLNRQLNTLVGQYASIIGLKPGFDYDFQVYDASQAEARSAPVFNAEAIMANSQRIAGYVSESVRPGLMNLISMITALSEMVQSSTLDLNLRNEVMDRLHHLQNMLSNIFSLTSGIDMTLVELSNVVAQRDLIHRLRNGHKISRAPKTGDVRKGDSSNEQDLEPGS